MPSSSRQPASPGTTCISTSAASRSPSRGPGQAALVSLARSRCAPSLAGRSPAVTAPPQPRHGSAAAAVISVEGDADLSARSHTQRATKRQWAFSNVTTRLCMVDYSHRVDDGQASDGGARTINHRLSQSRSLLQIIDVVVNSVHAFNYVNIATALNRIGRIVSSQSKHVEVVDSRVDAMLAAQAARALSLAHNDTKQAYTLNPFQLWGRGTPSAESNRLLAYNISAALNDVLTRAQQDPRTNSGSLAQLQAALAEVTQCVRDCDDNHTEGLVSAPQRNGNGRGLPSSNEQSDDEAEVGRGSALDLLDAEFDFVSLAAAPTEDFVHGFFKQPAVDSTMLPWLSITLNLLTWRAKATLEFFLPREAANVLWGSWRAGFLDVSLASSMLRRVLHHAEHDEGELDGHSVSLFLYFLANNHWYMEGDEHLDAYSMALVLAQSATAACDDTMEPQSVANIIWSLAILRMMVQQEPQIAECVSTLCVRAVTARDDFLPMELGMLMSSLAYFASLPAARETVKALTPAAIRTVRTLPTQDPALLQTVSSVFWASTCVLGEENQDMLAAVTARKRDWLRNPNIDFIPQVLWSYGMLRHYEADVMSTCLDHLFAGIEADVNRRVSDDGQWIYACVKLNVPFTPYQAQLTQHLSGVMLKGRKLSLKQLAMLVWSLGAKGIYNTELREAAKARIASLCSTFDDEQLRNLPERFNGALLSQVLIADVWYHTAPVAGKKSAVVDDLLQLLRSDPVMPEVLFESTLKWLQATILRNSQGRASRFQELVFSVLKGMGTNPTMEFVTPDGLHTVDVVMRAKNGMRIAVEADGPSHFRANKPFVVSGETVARNRTLTAMGWTVISVPWYVWQRQSTAEQTTWMRTALMRALRNGDAQSPAVLADVRAD